MDFLAHLLWTSIIFNKQKKWYLALPFGVLPDLCSWFIYMIYEIFVGGSFGKPLLQQIPTWVITLYGISHSIFVAAVVLAIVYLIFRKIPFYLWAYPIHILIDIPSHSRSFLPTPFLWPVSNWYFPGISWDNHWFMIVNYTLIIICLGYIFWKRRKK